MPSDTLTRPLDPKADLPAVEALFHAAADYVALETGLPVDGSQAADFLTGAPPGLDPASSLRLGVFDAAGQVLLGGAEVAFGYPRAEDAYIGLMIFAPALRRGGHGRALLRRIEAEAVARGADRLLVAVLEANTNGMGFWTAQGFALEKLVPDRQMGQHLHQVHRLAKPLRPAPVAG